MLTCERCEEPVRSLTTVTDMRPRILNGDIEPPLRTRRLCGLCVRNLGEHVEVNDWVEDEGRERLG